MWIQNGDNPLLRIPYDINWEAQIYGIHQSSAQIEGESPLNVSAAQQLFVFDVENENLTTLIQDVENDTVVGTPGEVHAIPLIAMFSSSLLGDDEWVVPTLALCRFHSNNATMPGWSQRFEDGTAALPGVYIYAVKLYDPVQDRNIVGYSFFGLAPPGSPVPPSGTELSDPGPCYYQVSVGIVESASLLIGDGYDFRNRIAWKRNGFPRCWYYNSAHQPSGFTVTQAWQAIDVGFTAWESDGDSYVDWSYCGTSARNVKEVTSESPPYHLVGWDPTFPTDSSALAQAFCAKTSPSNYDMYDCWMAFNTKKSWSIGGNATTRSLKMIAGPRPAIGLT